MRPSPNFPNSTYTCNSIPRLPTGMELQTLWQLFHPVQACAVGDRCNPSPSYGGLCLVNMYEFSKRKRTVNRLSYRSDTGLFRPSLSRSQVDHTVSEPLQLLPCTKPSFSMAGSLEEELDTFASFDSFQSLYRVELTTSNNAYSGLADINAGILICIIGENGSSIIQRIPALASNLKVSSAGTAKFAQNTSDHICFQRGSLDIVTFGGPDLGRLAEIWIGPESGSWRLERVNVMVVPLVQRLGDGVNNIEQENKGSIGLYYIFQTKEIVLGDGGDLSAAELKPCEIQQLSGSDIWMESLSSVHLGRRMPSEDLRKLQQEGLREYKDLKFSLLLYNVILVASGTSIMAIVGNQEISNGFAIGGVCGFIYLVLLERAVDRLPGSPSFSSNSTNEKSSFEDDNISGGQLVDVNESNMSSQVDSNKNFREMFLGFRGPSTSLIWIIATVFVASKYLPGNITIALKPQELLAGAAGFLTCKVAVVIAAFRTLSADWKNYRK